MENKILEIINKYDPLTLFPGELAPKNEYDIEAKKIASILKNLNNPERDNIYFIVYYVFDKMFGTDFSEEDILRMSKISNDIFSLIKGNKN